MRSIFDYLDYRDVLKDAFEDRKSQDPDYTYRQLALALGMHPSNMHHLLQKKRHLPARCQARAVEYLALKDRTAAYFLLLVSYARERAARNRREILEKAMALRDVHRFELGDKDLAYLDEWWIAAVRGALEILDGNANPREIAGLLEPPITEAQAAHAIEVLRELGLVRRASSGRWKVAEPHLGVSRSEARIQAVRRYQRKLLHLASDAIERIPPEHRDVTTLSMVVDEDAFLKIRDILKECRVGIQKSADGARKPDRVLQLVMACIPMTRVEDRP